MGMLGLAAGRVARLPPPAGTAKSSIQWLAEPPLCAGWSGTCASHTLFTIACGMSIQMQHCLPAHITWSWTTKHSAVPYAGRCSVHSAAVPAVARLQRAYVAWFYQRAHLPAQPCSCDSERGHGIAGPVVACQKLPVPDRTSRATPCSALPSSSCYMIATHVPQNGEHPARYAGHGAGASLQTPYSGTPSESV